jgi:hypothetical protein
MNEGERDELLIRLDERVEHMHKTQVNFIDTATSPEGWGRCQVHATKIESAGSFLKWTKRTFSVAALGLIGKVLYSTFWGGP